MADGDTSTITTGKWKGYTRLDIDKATATSHDLVAALADNKIHIPYGILTVEGAAITGRVLEETSADLIGGPYRAVTSGLGAVITIDEKDAVHSLVKGKKAYMTLSATSILVGFIFYKYVN